MPRAPRHFPAFSAPCVLLAHRSSCLPLPSSRRRRAFASHRVVVYATLQDDRSPTVKTLAAPPPVIPRPAPSETSLGALDALPTSLQNGLLLSMVPFLWGSYGVAAKFLFDTSHPMPLSLLNLSSFTLALLSLMFARRLQSTAPAPLSQLRHTYRAGIELGTYLYLGSWLNLEALTRTSASRSAFFVQLTTVIVPLAEWLLGAKVEPQVFAACAVAMAGAGVLSQSADPAVGELSATVFGALNVGDIIAVASAMFYSMHVLRLERLSKKSVGATVLVQVKTLTQVVWSAFAVALVMAQGNTEVASYALNFMSMPAGDIVSAVWWSFWIGAITSALSTWAQVVGQERVGPSRAAVFYASQPLFAAGLACAVGIDRLTPQEVIGGGLIVAAGALLTIGDRRGKRRGGDEASSP